MDSTMNNYSTTDNSTNSVTQNTNNNSNASNSPSVSLLEAMMLDDATFTNNTTTATTMSFPPLAQHYTPPPNHQLSLSMAFTTTTTISTTGNSGASPMSAVPAQGSPVVPTRVDASTSTDDFDDLPPFDYSLLLPTFSSENLVDPFRNHQCSPYLDNSMGTSSNSTTTSIGGSDFPIYYYSSPSCSPPTQTEPSPLLLSSTSPILLSSSSPLLFPSTSTTLSSSPPPPPPPSIPSIPSSSSTSAMNLSNSPLLLPVEKILGVTWFLCPHENCDYKNRRRDVVEKHCRSLRHTGTRSVPCPNHCGIFFNRPDSAIKHIRNNKCSLQPQSQPAKLK